MKRIALRLALAGRMLLALAGCSDGPAAGEELAKSPLIGGSPNGAGMPAIGILNNNGSPGCTATLISSRVIISAAHCFGFDTSKSGYGNPFASDDSAKPSFYGITSTFSFTLENGGSPITRNVLRFWVADTHFGAMDVAVAELDADVPASVATPLRIATSYPNDGDWVAVWGAGAISGTTFQDDAGNYGWNPDVMYLPGGYAVQGQLDTWNASIKNASNPHSCPGVSGGPLVNAQGEVVMVSSAAGCTSPGAGPDLRGDVVAIASSVNNAATFYGVAQLCEGCGRYALRAANGQYLQAFNGGGSSLNAAGPGVGNWETFRWVALSLTHFALQASNGYFVSADQGGGGLVTVDKTQIGFWETFSTTDLNNVVLNTLSTGEYVTVPSNTTSVRADASSAGANETFVAVPVP